MKNEKLEQLVSSGDILTYTYENLDENGKSTLDDDVVGMRNTEKLVLTFQSGRILCLDMICSGSMENLSFIIDVDDELRF